MTMPASENNPDGTVFKSIKSLVEQVYPYWRLSINGILQWEKPSPNIYLVSFKSTSKNNARVNQRFDLF